jgi:hypothetical protein
VSFFLLIGFLLSNKSEQELSLREAKAGIR